MNSKTMKCSNCKETDKTKFTLKLKSREKIRCDKCKNIEDNKLIECYYCFSNTKQKKMDFEYPNSKKPKCKICRGEEKARIIRGPLPIDECIKCKNDYLHENFYSIEKKICKICYNAERNKKYGKTTNQKKQQNRIEYNRTHPSTKICSSCNDINPREDYKNLKDEINVGSCSKCCKKSQKNPEDIKIGERASKLAEYAERFVIDEDIDESEILVWCDGCNKDTLLEDLSICRFLQFLCENCEGTSKIKESVFKDKIKKFNKNNKEVHICTTCCAIKLIRKFKGAKDDDVNRCDICRGKPEIKEKVEITENNKKVENVKKSKSQREKERIMKEIKMLEEKHKNNLKVQVCHYRKCKDRVCSKNEFVCNPGRCKSCRIKASIGDKKRQERDKLNGNSTEKSQKRQNNHVRQIMDFRADNLNPNIYICGARDCEKRDNPLSDYVNLDPTAMNKCKKCRKKQLVYDRKSKAKARQDPEKVAHINKVHNEWVKNHPENVRESNRRKRVNATTKVNSIIYKAREVRNIPFELTMEQAIELCMQDCHYCEDEISDETINGIDRVDSGYGYTEQNCVPCCRFCNFSKGTADKNDFINRMKHIAYHIYPEECKQKWYFPNAFFNDKNKSGYIDLCRQKYHAYKKECIRRGIEFYLKEYEYNYLKRDKCYYCGQREFIRPNLIGIDRVNSLDSYTYNNCVSCCSCCNYLKNEYDLIYFMEKVLKIERKN